MHAVGAAVSVPPPDPEMARVRLSEGIPALAGEPLLTGSSLAAACLALSHSLSTSPTGRAAGVADGVGAAAAALASSRLTPAERDALAAAVVAGAWADVADVAARLDVDEHALIATLDYATRPALRRAAELLQDIVNDSRWPHGNCPVCGAPPLLAELRGADRPRSLRCGRCASSWEWPRLGCPACGERDHRQLTSLHADGEEDFRRADCCRRCRRYVKALATLEPFSPDALLEADLASSALDWIAIERGYVK
jgi:FdhE protein